MAYQQTGEKTAAREALRVAVESKVDYPGKDEARKALAELK